MDEMYHYDPAVALEELAEDAVLPPPVHMRDMMLRSGVDPDAALELQRQFRQYLRLFGEAQQTARTLLEELLRRHEASSGGQRKSG